MPKAKTTNGKSNGSALGFEAQFGAAAEYRDEYLAALRDALLPKLLSGELRVPAAAQVTNEKRLR